jgi:hypothetical protein
MKDYEKENYVAIVAVLADRGRGRNLTTYKGVEIMCTPWFWNILLIYSPKITGAFCYLNYWWISPHTDFMPYRRHN